LRYRGPDVAEELQGFSVASVLTLAAVLAAAEEVAFRSIILPRLRRLTGRWWPAVLICSLLFGAFHWAGGPSLILGTMAISVAFCLVFIGARSLIAASIAHYLYNMTLYMLSKPDVVT
jgi:membrane protease YdiL (CAAX protease family)